MDPLHQLLDVQEHDTHLDQLRHRREAHPLRGEAAGAEQRLADAAARQGELRGRIDDLATRQDHLEAEVADIETRLAGLDKRMYSGDAGAPRDLQAMSEQADGFRRRRRDLEDRILELMEEREPLDAADAELQREVAEAGAEMERLRSALDAAERELRAEEDAEAEVRARAAAQVPPDMLRRYEAVRARLGGVAVARLVNGVCGGCHLALSATELDHIRHLPLDRPATCEQCGRLLVRG